MRGKKQHPLRKLILLILNKVLTAFFLLLFLGDVNWTKKN